MKKIKYLCFVGIVSLTVSCVNTKRTGHVWITSGNNLYKNSDTTISGSPVNVAAKHQLQQGMRAEVELSDDEDYIEITPVDAEQTSLVDTVQNSSVSKGNGSYYFANDEDFSLKAADAETRRTRSRYIAGDKLVYWKGQFVSQAVSIPIKYRFPTTKWGADFPYDAETDFNAGYAFGWQQTRVKAYFIYHQRAGEAIDFDTYKLHERTISFSWAGFVGPVTQTLGGDNTGNTIAGERNVLGYSAGGLVVLGVNRFNFGLALGYDDLFGKTIGNRWAYDRRPWLGFVVALDFVELDD